MKINMQLFGGRSNSSGMSSSGSNGTFNSASSIRSFLQNKINEYGLGISKRDLADDVYKAARAKGMDVVALNDKYLSVSNENGHVDFSFTKLTKEGKWQLTPILEYGAVIKTRHLGQMMYKSSATKNYFSTKYEAEWDVVKARLG